MNGTLGSSGPERHDSPVARRRPIDDHPFVQSLDGLAARPDEQPRDHRMDEACQGRGQQRNPESEGVALMLQIALAHRARVVEE